MGSGYRCIPFFFLCKIHLIVDPLLRRLNNLFIPSCAVNVCQKQLGLQQQQKPSFWRVDR